MKCTIESQLSMALSFATTTSNVVCPQSILLQSQFLHSSPYYISSTSHQRISINHLHLKKIPPCPSPPAIKCSTSPPKLVRDPRLDKQVSKQNNIRFVLKLKTLLLSKPKHFMPIHILYKCRAYLSLPKPRSMISMILRYPTIFELFTIPTPPNPLRAAGPLTQLCVRLTPEASDLAKREIALKKFAADSSAQKLQKLLMMAPPYHRLLLSKLVHLGPDLGLPVNFRSRLCNDHPQRFKVVDTSYGRALELVNWDENLAKAFPPLNEVESLGLIVDRPLKFKHLRLRKGLNVKKGHRDFLLKFKEIPDFCPYKSDVRDLVKESIEAEKRACAVVREVLFMTVEKRTLVDHLTHFRREFGLPNRLRGMLVRHPEIFYVSLKGQRDSVFLVEGYNDRGKLVEKNELLEIRDELMKLVREGKRMRRERRRGHRYKVVGESSSQILDDDDDDDDDDGDFGDGLDDLFDVEDDDVAHGDDSAEELTELQESDELWMSEMASSHGNQDSLGSTAAPW